MSVVHRNRAAMRLTVLVVAVSASLALAAGVAGASAPAAETASASATGFRLIGLPVSTAAWAVCGLLVLVVGLVAATRSGRRGQVLMGDSVGSLVRPAGALAVSTSTGVGGSDAGRAAQAV